MIKKVTLLASVLLISGCSITAQNCFKTVAVTDLTIKKAAETVTMSANGDIASVGDHENAAKVIKAARKLTDEAAPFCIGDKFDKEQAFSMLGEVNDMIMGL